MGLSDLFGSDRSASKSFARQKDLLLMEQAFVERMSNSAHQREVADLRAAGLNPILSALSGSGASTPTVSAPSVSPGIPTKTLAIGDFNPRPAANNRSQEDRFDSELQRLLIANERRKGVQIDAAVLKEQAETARIIRHIAEGVGTPQQTKNVVFDVISNMVDDLWSSARTIHDINRESLETFYKDQQYYNRKREFERRKRK